MSRIDDRPGVLEIIRALEVEQGRDVDVSEVYRFAEQCGYDFDEISERLRIMELDGIVLARDSQGTVRINR